MPNLTLYIQTVGNLKASLRKVELKTISSQACVFNDRQHPRIIRNFDLRTNETFRFIDRLMLFLG